MQVILSGPTNVTVNLTLSGSAFVGTINDVPVGTYSLAIVGTGGGLVTYYGINNSVQVRGGENTNAAVTLTEFEPVLDPFVSPTASFALEAFWQPIAGATEYEVEASFDPNFTTSNTFITTNTSFELVATGLGTA